MRYNNLLEKPTFSFSYVNLLSYCAVVLVIRFVQRAWEMVLLYVFCASLCLDPK